MIDSKKLDPNFKYEVARELGGGNVKRCFSCGTCTVGCPIRLLDETYNPRKIIHMVLLGMRDRVLKSEFIWLCSQCYTCYDRCPQDVKLTDIMTALKNIAVREGYIHPALREQARLIGLYGRLYEIEDFDNKRRDKLGLPLVKKTFDDVIKIIDNSSLKKVIK